MKEAATIQDLEKDAYYKLAFTFLAGPKLTSEQERILAELRMKWGIRERAKKTQLKTSK